MQRKIHSDKNDERDSFIGINNELDNGTDKNDEIDSVTDKNAEVVTLPVSDTVPAPGNYTVKMLNFHGQGMPVVDSTDLIDTYGAGTAQDVASVMQAPDPGVDSVDRNSVEAKETNDREQ